MPSGAIDRFLGRWSVSGRAIDVVRRGDEVIVTILGIPEEFSPRLVHDAADPAAGILRGGHLDGTTIRVLDDDGTDRLIVGDVLSFPRWNDDSPVSPVMTHLMPPPDVDPATEASYRAMLHDTLSANGAVVEPVAGIDVGAWVHWLTQQDTVLFHGSQNGDIEALAPRRTSYEINNQAGRGNLAAVYATHAGLWAMWFSIIDRSRVRGSIRSGAEEHVRPDGVRLPAYYFSLNHRQLADPPLSDGWLYLLPRDTFERQPLFPGGSPSPEWCSRHTVRPLARIPIRPHDFPLLDRIGGHDDSELLRYHELVDVIRENTEHATATSDGVVLRLVWSPTLADIIDEYMVLSRAMMPDISRTLQHDGQDSAYLHLQTTPELAVMLHNSFHDLMAG
ncbi:hypothetical protein [Phytoactinopolyspora halotolerans]|uniref:Uncharacterized protein n=1 Tax=Phytoactinopolyspora halotolerans TaxID=1981512 RepID=A0A6L9SK15_9ACTN|nr:hypothetical protein [Phytoactinopolyspora halotolerans]NEE04661.1 hypothetical protein [Phytoactinopolyspora halotolerans]